MAFAANGLFAVLLFVFWVWAILDVIIAESGACRFLPKLVWLLIVLLFADIGALAWVIFGRPPRGSWKARISDYGQQRRPIAVEDQPSFSAPSPAISDRRSQELDRQLDEWEAEQRRQQSERDGET